MFSQNTETSHFIENLTIINISNWLCGFFIFIRNLIFINVSEISISLSQKPVFYAQEYFIYVLMLWQNLKPFKDKDNENILFLNV